MPRTSKRHGIYKEYEKYKAALYARISVDDDSNTIDNQLDLLRSYATRNNMCVYKEYVDIGKTGTSFSREGFKDMLKDIQDRKVNVVIVKDLSRFGRNYIETGEYIEKIFPKLGVRFIAINDRYDSMCSKDSLNTSSLFNYNIKNLVNEMYAMDISKKVRSSIRMKQMGDKPYSASVIPYGYKKSKNNEHIYEIDENVSWIIEKIFTMHNEDISITDITMWLCKMKINSPSVYRKEGKIYSDGEYTNWNKSTVYRILHNKIYYGVLEVNKTTSEFYNDKKVKKTDIKDRIYFENAVEGIVNKSV